jgi:hypothetical protein
MVTTPPDTQTDDTMPNTLDDPLELEGQSDSNPQNDPLGIEAQSDPFQIQPLIIPRRTPLVNPLGKEPAPGEGAALVKNTAQELWSTRNQGIVSPEDVPTGAEMTTSTGIPKIATIPASAIAKLGAGFVGYVTSPEGAAMTVGAATPAAPAVFAKWAYDMLKGGYASMTDAVDAVGQKINDAFSRKMFSANALGKPQEQPHDEFVQRLAEDAVNAAGMIIGGVGAAKQSISKAVEIAKPVLQPVQPITTGENYASDITSPEGIPSQQVRPGVDETPPLRQQGEVTGTRPPVNTPQQRPSPQPTAPVNEPAPPPQQPVVAPVVYRGFQQGYGELPGQHLYNLTADIPGTAFAKGSTVTRNSLEQAGFTIPPVEAEKEIAPSSEPAKVVPSSVQVITQTQQPAPVEPSPAPSAGAASTPLLPKGADVLRGETVYVDGKPVKVEGYDNSGRVWTRNPETGMDDVEITGRYTKQLPTPPAEAKPAAPAQAGAREAWQMTRAEYHDQFPRTEAPKVQTESELNTILKDEAKALEKSGDITIEKTKGGQNFRAKTDAGRKWIADAQKRSFDRLTNAGMSAGIKANEAATIAGEASSHKIAIQEAIRAGETIPPEVLADYPDLQARVVQKENVAGRDTPVKPAGEVETPGSRPATQPAAPAQEGVKPLANKITMGSPGSSIKVREFLAKHGYSNDDATLMLSGAKAGGEGTFEHDDGSPAAKVILNRDGKNYSVEIYPEPSGKPTPPPLPSVVKPEGAHDVYSIKSAGGNQDVRISVDPSGKVSGGAGLIGYAAKDGGTLYGEDLVGKNLKDVQKDFPSFKKQTYKVDPKTFEIVKKVPPEPVAKEPTSAQDKAFEVAGAASRHAWEADTVKAHQNAIKFHEAAKAAGNDAEYHDEMIANHRRAIANLKKGFPGREPATGELRGEPTPAVKQEGAKPKTKAVQEREAKASKAAQSIIDFVTSKEAGTSTLSDRTFKKAMESTYSTMATHAHNLGLEVPKLGTYFAEGEYRKSAERVLQQLRPEAKPPSPAPVAAPTVAKPATVAEPISAIPKKGLPGTSEDYQIAKEIGYRTAKAFERDYTKNAASEVKESRSEFAKRRFCSETVPVGRAVLSE